jgi:hypothetical protein
LSRCESETPAGNQSEVESQISARLDGLTLKGGIFRSLIHERRKSQQNPSDWQGFASTPLNINTLDRAMHRASGSSSGCTIHELGNDVVMVGFGSEGDWKHVLSNGRQPDFKFMVLKDNEGTTGEEIPKKEKRVAREQARA